MANFNAFIDCMDHIRESGNEWPKLKTATASGQPISLALGQDGVVFVKAGWGFNDTVIGVLKRGGASVWFQDRMKSMPGEHKASLGDLMRGLRDAPVETLGEMGKTLGFCAVCGRPLSAEESVGRGIGPVCWERMTGG